MAKRIVYCADGTWDDPVKNTNVYRLYTALTTGADQVKFYDDGVGAGLTGLQHLLAGAFGDGLYQKVQDGYATIAKAYQPGDEIYLFGFSRGAYTARSIAGMIATCGLVTGTVTNDCVTQAFAAYRTPANRVALLSGMTSCGLTQENIRMIGVWDTVGALGIPAIFGGVDEAKYGFLDTSLHPNVKNAYQCLAIDEQRAQFPATLWSSAPAAGQTIEQVWFAGCHGDVGGGTPLAGGVDAGTRLCDITFAWMVAKAQALGLTFDPAAIAPFAHLTADEALDAIRQSWKPVDGPPHLRPIAANSEIANSVAVRIQYDLSYTPGNLTINDEALASEYSGVTVVDEDAV